MTGWGGGQMALRSESRAGARRQGVTLSDRFRGYLVRHLQTFFYALGQLSRTPFSTLMTSAVVGIALAMPVGLYVLLGNAQQVVSGWEGSTAQISLFLEKSVGEEDARTLAEQLRGEEAIASVDYISREQALEEFRALSGFGKALDFLDENPLPAVLVIHPSLEGASPDRLAKLVASLDAYAQVENAQLDMAWVRRLFALMDIARRGVTILALLLGLAVMLVVGNTIRLMIQNRRDEIIITKLIGGTDRFIRRPFLYSGLWYGLFGGLIATVLVEVSLSLLKGPVEGLAALYHSDFHLVSVDTATAATLLLFSALLGLIGSGLAVGRHLREIEPR